ncbi:MAG: hypothetical protein JXR65_03210 [Bacteroidales bacterium]|nr:hypothetical protein [Bacteroidales bacterium]
MSNIFNLFLKYNPDFLEKIDLFSEELKEKILNKLKKATTETAFLSLVSEINFGLLFTELGFYLQYEKISFDTKTPDWTILIDERKAICEVYRLGQSGKDQIITNLNDKLKRGFEEIKYGYKIKFSHCEDFISSNDNDIKNMLSDLENWLSNTREIGDVITIGNKIEFEITSLNQNAKLTYTTSAPIDYKLHKLVQSEYLKSDNRITEKLLKYSTGISQLKLPYFLCIESDCKNGFNFEEFISYFQCSFCVCSEDDILNNIENEFECSGLGCLYDHPTVSGIIIKIGNDYRKILNPLKNQLIYNQDNYPIFSKMNMINNANS